MVGFLAVKRIYRFVEPIGVVTCTVEGAQIDLPVFAGVLKHPSVDQLCELLADPAVAGKYMRDALRKLPWSALRQSPRDWLMTCLRHAQLPEGRRRALEFMLRL